MEAFYWEIRIVHIAAVLTSGAVLLLRGLAFNLFRAPWALSAPVRYISWTVDTVLLTAALMLMTIIKQYPIANAWLTVKIMLILVYIALGFFALRASSARMRIASLGGAALVFGYIYMVARAHDPLGMFA